MGISTDKPLTIAQYAALLGVHRGTVERWIQTGKMAELVIRLPSGRVRIKTNPDEPETSPPIRTGPSPF